MQSQGNYPLIKTDYLDYRRRCGTKGKNTTGSGRMYSKRLEGSDIET